jgi:cob(I)alamin adenosyltransferase
MVYINKIYTKSGDQGTTGLGDGSRVSKSNLRIEAIGDVDELNASMGILIIAPAVSAGICRCLQKAQNDLFDVGADLSVPLEQNDDRLRVNGTQIKQLEDWIDQFNARLKPLNSFILPGGSPAAAYCHMARTICRRAERRVVSLSEQVTINPQVIVYLNRLSDLLFVFGRCQNNDGDSDVLWVPGENQLNKE